MFNDLLSFSNVDLPTLLIRRRVMVLFEDDDVAGVVVACVGAFVCHEWRLNRLGEIVVAS